MANEHNLIIICAEFYYSASDLPSVFHWKLIDIYWCCGQCNILGDYASAGMCLARSLTVAVRQLPRLA